MRPLFFLMLFLAARPVFAQHDNIWYFGKWAGLDFSTGTPAALTNSVMWAMEGSAVMSDVEGNLLFYTNGVTVWNRNHQVMQNGTGLLGNNSTTQAAMIIPKPGEPAHYYIFTPDDAGGPDGLHYSEVDMDGAGGLGEVINKNVALVTPVCEKVAAAFHSNGTDIWVVTHHWGTNAFYSYLVTAAGVNPVPVISNAGTVIAGANNSGRYAGYMAISPDASRLAIFNQSTGVELFDLDNTTGAVSNPVSLLTEVDGYGVEFSPSGKLLYVSDGLRLLQYQVNVPDPAATGAVIATTEYNGAIKIGPDSKLYFISKALSTAVAVINDPEIIGTGCNYVNNQVPLAGRQNFVGLPAFLTSPFYITGLDIAHSCSGGEVSFALQSTIPADTVLWDFGDGNTSTLPNPVHVYAAPGTYTVRATAGQGIFRRYFTQTVTVLPSATANQPAGLFACDEGNDGAETFDLAVQDAEILGTQPPAEFSVTYHLTLADAEQGINAITGLFTNTGSPQEVYARVSADNNDLCPAITSFTVRVFPVPVIAMGDSYHVCNNESIALTAPAGFSGYEWSTGETTRTIIAAAGNYTLTVFEDHGDIVCESTMGITVTASGMPLIKDIEISDWTDNHNSITVIAEGLGSYEYSLDGITYQDSNTFNGLPAGLYTVHVRDRNGCGAADEDVALLMYPRFFTPNGDGINDNWRIAFSNFEPGMIVNIMDRYGKVVGSFTGGDTGWDGTYNGRMLPSTDYWFLVSRGNGREYRGHFSMIR